MGNLTNLLQQALKCVDKQDINREFSDAQMRYAKNMTLKQLNIAEANKQLKDVRNKTKEKESEIKNMKDSLLKIRKTLS